MAWIELHQTLPTNKKTIRFKNLLRISVPQAVGHLCILWLWALDNASDGDLSGFTAAEIAEFASWSGESANEFVQALIKAGFIDSDMILHDWYDYAGKLVDKRRQNAERMRAKRAELVQRTCNTCAGTTVPNRTVPNQLSPDGDNIPPLSPINGGQTPDYFEPERPGVPLPSEPKPRRKKASALSKVLEARFNRFWAIYPRRVSIGDAERAWAKIEPSDDLTDRIIASVDKALTYDSRFRETQFTPLPATWLNQRGWENEYEVNVTANATVPKAGSSKPNTLRILADIAAEGGISN